MPQHPGRTDYGPGPAELDGDKLSENDVGDAFAAGRGHETTIHLIGGGILALLQIRISKLGLLPTGRDAAWRSRNCSLCLPGADHQATLSPDDMKFHGQRCAAGLCHSPAARRTSTHLLRHPEQLTSRAHPTPMSRSAAACTSAGAQVDRMKRRSSREAVPRFPTVAAMPAAVLHYTGRPHACLDGTAVR